MKSVSIFKKLTNNFLDYLKFKLTVMGVIPIGKLDPKNNFKTINANVSIMLNVPIKKPK